jgi:hypothetical protein
VQNLTDFTDKETFQDLQKLRLVKDTPHHPRFRDWLHTISTIGEKYEESSAPSTVPRDSSRLQHVPSDEMDEIRAEVNKIPDSQLHLILRHTETSSFWRLKCQVDVPWLSII